MKISHRGHWHVSHEMYEIWSRVLRRGLGWWWMRRVVCLVVWRRLWYVSCIVTSVRFLFFGDDVLAILIGLIDISSTLSFGKEESLTMVKNISLIITTIYINRYQRSTLTFSFTFFSKRIGYPPPSISTGRNRRTRRHTLPHTLLSTQTSPLHRLSLQTTPRILSHQNLPSKR